MRIALSGAQGTGKTTLINLLKEDDYYDGYYFEQEITRRLVKRGFSINKSGNAETQLLIINEHFGNLYRENMITDRCLLDAFIYTLYLYKYLEGDSKIPDWVFNYNNEMVDEYIHRYDIIFYIPPEFDPEEDGVRSTDVEYRDKIHELFMRIINQKSIPVTVLTGSVEERLQTIKRKIEYVKNSRR